VLKAAVESAGFIRFIGFGEGLCNYALVFWRSVEEAATFAAGAIHRNAVSDLYRTGSQYTHFASLYETTGRPIRHFFCDSCGKATVAPAAACSHCGHRLVDVFASNASVDGAGSNP
jgi:hypothetical protein